MTTERQQRIGFLLRKNAGEKKRPIYQEKLSRILSKGQHDVAFLSLEESEKVAEAFFAEVRANEEGKVQSRTKLSRAGWDSLEQDLLKIRDFATDRQLYVLLPDADCVGAFPLAEKDFLLHGVRLYQEFNENVCAVDPKECKYGIMIDYFEDFYHGIENFDAIFYGNARALMLPLEQKNPS